VENLDAVKRTARVYSKMKKATALKALGKIMNGLNGNLLAA
jgi:hypothetical protein